MPLTPQPLVVVATFTALATALTALWAPCVVRVGSADRWWVAPFALALAAAVAGDLVDTRGLLALAALVAACRLGEHLPDGVLRGLALAVVLVLAAGLLTHAVPGFANPVVIDGVRLSPDSLPYSKYLNLDKGVLGLMLLGLHAPARARRLPRAGSVGRATWQLAVVTAAVMAITVAIGYARWDPKVPSWGLLWLGSMVYLTALPEEALFRHVVQGGLHSWLGDTAPARVTTVLASAGLFGLAHIAGGGSYVLLATVAGLGYALVYARTGSLLAAVCAHTGLNLLHFLLFSYPALDPAAVSG